MILFTAHRKSGAPFPGGSADNGLSVDPIDGKIVLGSDLANLSDGQLLSPRFIKTNNQFIELIQIAETFLGAGFIRLFSHGAISGVFDFFDTVGNQVRMSIVESGALRFQMSYVNGCVLNFIATGNMAISPNAGIADNGARLQVDGQVTTSDPGSGIGKWKLGKKQAGAVALDAANFVEVEIDGVIVKLLVAV